MPTRSLGQIAYDAYGEQQEWLTEEGLPMPSWASVSVEIQAGWQAAGRAVAKQTREAIAETFRTHEPE